MRFHPSILRRCAAPPGTDAASVVTAKPRLSPHINQGRARQAVDPPLPLPPPRKRLVLRRSSQRLSVSPLPITTTSTHLLPFSSLPLILFFPIALLSLCRLSAAVGTGPPISKVIMTKKKKGKKRTTPKRRGPGEIRKKEEEGGGSE